MPTRIYESGPTVTAADIRRAEARTQMAFPDEYKQLLLLHNGGRTDPYVLPYRDADGRAQFTALHVLLALEDGRPGDVIDIRELMRRRTPAGLLPIGRDLIGNLVLIGTQPPNAGRVYLWIHDLPGDVDETDPANLGFVADSVAGFLSALRAKP